MVHSELRSEVRMSRSAVGTQSSVDLIKMNYYFFDHKTFDRIYNCSMLPEDEWAKRKEPNIFGAFYLILATIYQVYKAMKNILKMQTSSFQVLYIPFLVVMRRKVFWELSCYKLMFWLGVFDALATFIGGTLMGIFTLRGDIFCTNKDFLYLTSCFTASKILFVIQKFCTFQLFGLQPA